MKTEDLEREATLEAREDFIKINKKLESLKKKIQDFDITSDDVLKSIALINLGLILGSFTPKKLGKLLRGFALGINSYIGLRLFFDKKFPNEE